MGHATGFTLRELVVVILSAAMAALVLIPVSCGRATENANRAGCASNLNGISKGLTLYKGANDDCYPLIPGEKWDTTASGTNYNVSPFKISTGEPAVAARSVTSLEFMLVRDYQTPKIFTCRSDAGAKPDPQPQSSVTVSGRPTMQFNWDFSPGARHCSYSYQVPMADNKNGVPMNPDVSLAIMSDRAPGATSDMSFMSGWTAGGDPERFLGPNHGGVMNVLFADGHVGQQRTPNCGPILGQSGTLDCIFTAKDNTGNPDETLRQDGADFGGVQDYKQHKGLKDSYLSGGRHPG